MRRISFLLVLFLGLFVNTVASNNNSNEINYYKGEGETVTVHGILYVLNTNNRTATAIGSPTTETGYSELKEIKYTAYTRYSCTQHLPTTNELKKYMDSCGRVFTFPEFVEKDGVRYTLTRISQRRNPDLFNCNEYTGSKSYKYTYAWEYCGKSSIEIVVPESVTSIDGAFSASCIKKVTVHNNLRIIGDYTFRQLTTLKVAEKGETGDSIVVLPDALIL